MTDRLFDGDYSSYILGTDEIRQITDQDRMVYDWVQEGSIIESVAEVIGQISLDEALKDLQ